MGGAGAIVRGWILRGRTCSAGMGVGDVGGQGRTGLAGTAGSARTGLTQRADGNDPTPSFTTPRSAHPHSPAGSEPAQPPPPLPPPWFPVPLLPVTPLADLQLPDFALHPAAPLHWWRGPFPSANHTPQLLTPPPCPALGTGDWSEVKALSPLSHLSQSRWPRSGRRPSLGCSYL